MLRGSQAEVPMVPLLDPQDSKPTAALKSFADGIFNHLDYNCEPRGSGLLEQDKMAVLQGLILPHDHHAKVEEFRPILYNSYYMAFSVETTFGGDGPALSRAGFLTFLCSMIKSEPDEAFKDFGIFSRALKMESRFHRSQFPAEADPVARKISRDLKIYTTKTLLNIGMKVYKDPFCDVCFNVVGDTYQRCQDCNADFIACVSCAPLAPKNHIPGHKFKLNTSQTSKASQVAHEDISCDLCFTNPIVGIRYHCQDCMDFDVCQNCISQTGQGHIPGHRFLAMESSPSSMNRFMEQLQAQTQAQAQRQGQAAQHLSNMRVQMADRQTARYAEQSERLGRIGTGQCYECGYVRCRCNGGYNIMSGI